MKEKEKLEKLAVLTLVALLALSIRIMSLTAFAELPQPRLKVKEPSIQYGPCYSISKNFTIRIEIQDLPKCRHLIYIKFKLGFNSTLLQPINVTEGPFLSNFPNRLTPPYTSFSYSLNQNYVQVSNLLLPNATGGWTNFPEGEGTIAYITLHIIYQGPYGQIDSCPLDLFDIILLNAEGNPIPYEEPLDGTYTILGLEYPHDIAITSVTTSKTVVGHGYNITIHVTIKNQGSECETFRLFTFCGYRANLTLCRCNKIIINYTFNTGKLPKGDYRPWAWVPPCFGDNDTTDNICIGDTFTVTIPGDINNDKKVDMKDVGAAAKAFGSYPGHPRWNPNADIIENNKIDMRDIAIVAKNFGKT